MWIQELFIDAFDGADDLGLSGLSNSINVIRVPSDIEAKQLSRFVPAILYGDVLGNSRPRGGSLSVQADRAHSAAELVELSRVALADAAELDELQVIGDALTDEITGQLDGLGLDLFRAAFTDSLPPSERVAAWRHSAQVAALLKSTTVVVDEVPLDPGEPETDPAAIQAVQNWQLRRKKLSRQPRARDAAAPQSAHRLARQEYLEAQAVAKTVRHQIHQQREQLTRCESELAAMQRAIAIAEDWQQRERVRKQLSTLEKSAVTPDDLKRVRRLDRELTTVREELQRLRDSDCEPVDNQDHDHAKSLRKLLDRWPVCESQLERLESLRKQRQRVEATASDNFSNRLSEAAEQQIERVRRAAAAALPEVRSTNGETEAPAIDSVTEDRIDRLQRQVRQLRDGTRRLLARQRLSRHSLIGIGFMFSFGVAIMLAALVFDMDGAELSTGGIGLTCVIAATLLKLSFERAPTEELRQQRYRITRLLEEIAELRSDTPLTSSTSGDTLTTEQDDHRRATDVWQETLADMKLPRDCTVEQAIATIQRRSETRTTPRQTHEFDEQVSRCEHDIHQWCERAARNLSASDAPATTPEHARQWHQLATSEWHRIQAEQQQHRRKAAEDAREDAIVQLQQKIRKRKQDRREILQQFGVSDLAALEQQLATRSERKRLLQQLKSVQQQVDTALDNDPDHTRIREWMKNRVDLAELLEERQSQLVSAKSDLAKSQQQLQSIQQTIEQQTRVRREPTIAEQLVQEDHGPWDALDVAGAICQRMAEHHQTAESPRQVPVQREIVRPSAWIHHANSHFQFLMDDSTCSLRWNSVDGPLELHQGDRVDDWQQLDSPTQHLVAFALQLALAESIGESLGAFPLILRDASLRHSLATCRRIARKICEVTAQGQQILLVTSQEAVTHLFHELDMPSLVVTRQAVDVAPPTSDSIMVSTRFTSPVANRPSTSLDAHHPAAADLSLLQTTTDSYDRLDSIHETLATIPPDHRPSTPDSATDAAFADD